MRHRLATTLACSLTCSLACSLSAPALAQNLPTTPASVALVDFLNDYQADRRAIAEFYPVSFHPESYNRVQRLVDQTTTQLQATDFAALDQDGKIDYLLLRTLLESQTADLNLERQRLAELAPLIPFADTIAALERDRVAVKPLDFQEAALVLDTIDEEIAAVRARIEKGRDANNADEDRLPVSPVLANRASATVRRIARTLSDWRDYYRGFKPEFAWWTDTATSDAITALNGYADYLSQTIAGVHGAPDDPLIGDPIGREKLLADLASEWIPYTPEELIAIAEREFAWCEAEMRSAAADMGLGDDWRAALERVKQDHVPPGEQDQLVAFLSQEAIDFITQRDMVTIPPLAAELIRVEMIPPDQQRYYPFAFYGGNHIGVSYPTDEMSLDDKLMSMRGNNRHFTRAVVHHELIPGHHLQGFIAERERPYRQAFTTPFLLEGWCLYWEMTLYDAGFPQSPENRVGMLFWRMHRCARIIVSLRFHLGEMTPDQMIDFLVDRVGHERLTATSEVRRFIGGGFSPLYQCAYMLGGLQLRALRHELVEPGDMTERAFHDAVLAHNAIPVELIRAGLTAQELTPQTRPAWRFGDN
ncbi:MAG: DUF885 domain-containing protein [Phycisphaerales bacterium]|nr:DUF885 domain-containing protein [Phycisphaerales bacterium]